MQGIQKIDELEEKTLLMLELQERRETVKARLYIILKDEERLWKTRANNKWLRDGMVTRSSFML